MYLFFLLDLSYVKTQNIKVKKLQLRKTYCFELLHTFIAARFDFRVLDFRQEISHQPCGSDLLFVMLLRCSCSPSASSSFPLSIRLVAAQDRKSFTHPPLVSIFFLYV